MQRDEMANLAWAIERTIEGPTEAALDLYVGSASIDGNPPTALPRYVLSSTVPDNWIPLLPVELSDQGKLVSRLKRGAILQPSDAVVGWIHLVMDGIPRPGRYRRSVGWLAVRQSRG